MSAHRTNLFRDTAYCECKVGPKKCHQLIEIGDDLCMTCRVFCLPDNPLKGVQHKGVGYRPYNC